MDIVEDHEHAFFAHEDPRWLICSCGQYAVRTRDLIGQSAYRLIDPPQPILRLTAKPAPAPCEESVDVAEVRVRQDVAQPA